MWSVLTLGCFTLRLPACLPDCLAVLGPVQTSNFTCAEPNNYIRHMQSSTYENQLGSTDLNLGRPAILFDRACRVERQKIDFSSYAELVHVPNLAHTLQIHLINKLFFTQSSSRFLFLSCAHSLF